MGTYTSSLGLAKKALYDYFNEKKIVAHKANEIEGIFAKGFEKGWAAATNNPNNPARDADVVINLESGMSNPDNFGFAMGFVSYGLTENLRLILNKMGTYKSLADQMKKEPIFHQLLMKYAKQAKSIKIIMTKKERDALEWFLSKI